MSSGRIVSELGLVIPGGAETTRTTMARSLILLAERNDLWEGLAANPAAIPTAVEELLRLITPLNNMFRTVAEDGPGAARSTSTGWRCSRGTGWRGTSSSASTLADSPTSIPGGTQSGTERTARSRAQPG